MAGSGWCPKWESPQNRIKKTLWAIFPLALRAQSSGSKPTLSRPGPTCGRLPVASLDRTGSTARGSLLPIDKGEVW